MIASDFSRFADELIQTMTPHLPQLAAEFLQAHGPGVIHLELHDADNAEERTTAINYLTHDKWAVGSHVRQLIHEYDPKRELILQIELDHMVLTRRLSLTSVQPRHDAAETMLGA